MYVWLTALSSRVWAYLAAAMAALLVAWKIYRAGANANEMKDLNETLDNIRERDAIRKSLNHASDDDVINQLRAKGWFK